MSLIKQPFKYVEADDDGGFEYMPSESSQANLDDNQQENLLQLSAPSQQNYTVQQEKLSPTKIRNSNQSLVYSASSYDTEMMNSPQFGHQQNSVQPYILVNNQNEPQQQQRLALQVNQMVSNLSQLPSQTSVQKNIEIQNVVQLGQFQQQQQQNHPQQQYQNQPQQQQQSFIQSQSQQQFHPQSQQQTHPQSFRSTAQKFTELSPTKSQFTIQENTNSQTPVTVEQFRHQIEHLESQLLQERLNSEQLRVYNHIIKHELEKKLLSQGVFIIKDTNRACKQLTPTKSKRLSGSKIQTQSEAAIDLYLEIQHNRIQMQALQSEFKTKDAIIKHLEAQLRQSNEINELMKRHDNELQEQNEQLQGSIKQAMDTINKANATITSLEDEKEGLIGCIEEEENLIKDCNLKLEQEKQQSQKLQAQIKTIFDQLDESKVHVSQLERNSKVEKQHHRQIDGELQEKERLLQENNDQRVQLGKLISEKQKEILKFQFQLSESNDREIKYQQESKEYSRQFNESMQQMSLYKKQNDDQQSQINILNDNLEQITYEYESSMTKTDRMERQVQDSERLVYERDKQLQAKEEQMIKIIKRTKHLEDNQSYGEKLELKYKELQHKLHDVQKQKELDNIELTEDNQQKSQEITNLYQQISIGQIELREQKEAFQSVSNERQQIIEELDKMQDLLTKEQETNLKLDNELTDYRSIIHERENALAKLHIIQIKYQADIEYYENIINELQQKISQVPSFIHSASPKDQKLFKLQRTNDKLANILLRLNIEVQSQWPLQNFDNLLQNIETLTDQIDQCIPQSGILKSKQMDESQFDVTSQLAVKDKEIQLYRHLINSAQVHDLINEISQLEVKSKVLREKKEKSYQLSAPQQENQFGFQDHLMLEREKSINTQLSQLHQDLERLHKYNNPTNNNDNNNNNYNNGNKNQNNYNINNQSHNTSKMNKRQPSSQTERVDQYNDKIFTTQPQSVKDPYLFETFKPDPVITYSSDNFFKPSPSNNYQNQGDISNIPSKQQAKRRYFL